MTLIPAWKITLGYAPTQGARALPFVLQFLTQNLTQITKDFYGEQSTGEAEFMQSVYIDNSLNAQAVSIRFPALGQIITARNQTQGYYPIFVPNGRLAITAVSAGNVDVPIIFSNIFINPTVWSVV